MLLKKVFDKIKHILSLQKKKPLEKICSIEFFIDKKQEFNFLCNWSEIDGLDTAKFLARLLFAINSGYFNEEIIKTLSNNVSNPKDKEFVDDVIFTWGVFTKEWEKILEKEKINLPIIKPSKAFNLHDK